MNKPKEDLDFPGITPNNIIEIWSVCEHDGEPRTGWNCFPRKDQVDITAKPASSLDGYTMFALDTDPEEALALMRANAELSGVEMVSITKRTFINGREGYIVITYTPLPDQPPSTPPE